MDLSPQARIRLRWMEHFAKYRNGRLTCRHFGISPDTFYRWKRKYHPYDSSTLEDDTSTRRPSRLRKSLWDMNLINRIAEIKKDYPKWGKYRIAQNLKEQKFTISPSSIGRILSAQRRKRLDPAKRGLT